MPLVGVTEPFSDGKASFKGELVDNIHRSHENCLPLLDAADAYLTRDRIQLPEEPDAHRVLPDPECMTNPIRELDLAAIVITSIIWAPGFANYFN